MLRGNYRRAQILWFCEIVRLTFHFCLPPTSPPPINYQLKCCDISIIILKQKFLINLDTENGFSWCHSKTKLNGASKAFCIVNNDAFKHISYKSFDLNYCLNYKNFFLPWAKQEFFLPFSPNREKIEK